MNLDTLIKSFLCSELNTVFEAVSEVSDNLDNYYKLNKISPITDDFFKTGYNRHYLTIFVNTRAVFTPIFKLLNDSKHLEVISPEYNLDGAFLVVDCLLDLKQETSVLKYSTIKDVNILLQNKA